MRRRHAAGPPTHEAAVDVVRFDGWHLDIARRELRSADGQLIDLTTGEFDMLTVLLRRAGRVLSREALMDMTRGRNLEAFDRTIDAQIARLRKKIEVDPAEPLLIKSVRGVGYVFTGKVEG